MKQSEMQTTLISKICDFEKFIYTHKETAHSAIADYNSFGREDSLFSERLKENILGYHDHLKQFGNDLGFISTDISTDLHWTKSFQPDDSKKIEEYNQFLVITIDVMKALYRYLESQNNTRPLIKC